MMPTPASYPPNVPATLLATLAALPFDLFVVAPAARELAAVRRAHDRLAATMPSARSAEALAGLAEREHVLRDQTLRELRAYYDTLEPWRPHLAAVAAYATLTEAFYHPPRDGRPADWELREDLRFLALDERQRVFNILAFPIESAEDSQALHLLARAFGFSLDGRGMHPDRRRLLDAWRRAPTLETLRAIFEALGCRTMFGFSSPGMPALHCAGGTQPRLQFGGMRDGNAPVVVKGRHVWAVLDRLLRAVDASDRAAWGSSAPIGPAPAAAPPPRAVAARAVPGQLAFSL